MIDMMVRVYVHNFFRFFLPKSFSTRKLYLYTVPVYSYYLIFITIDYLSTISVSQAYPQAVYNFSGTKTCV